MNTRKKLNLKIWSVKAETVFGIQSYRVWANSEAMAFRRAQKIVNGAYFRPVSAEEECA